MADKIQPVNVGAGAGVAIEAIRRNSDDESGELVFHQLGQDWTDERYRTDYPASLDARRFSTRFFDGHNRAMFDRQGSRHDTDIAARERRWNALRLLYPGYIIPVGPFNMPFVRHVH